MIVLKVIRVPTCVDVCRERTSKRENVMGGQSGASPHVVKVEVFSKVITSYIRKGCLTRPRRQPVRCPHPSKLSGICAVREAAIGKRKEGLRRMCWLCVVVRIRVPHPLEYRFDGSTVLCYQD